MDSDSGFQPSRTTSERYVCFKCKHRWFVRDKYTGYQWPCPMCASAKVAWLL